MFFTVAPPQSPPQSRLIDTAALWLANGQGIWLCTLLEGRVASTDRPGSMLAVGQGGRRVGSLSDDGTDEEMLIRLICGDVQGRIERIRCNDGSREVLVERLVPSDHLFDHLRGMRECLLYGDAARRLVCLASGRFELIQDLQPDCPVMLTGTNGSEIASIRIAHTTL